MNGGGMWYLWIVLVILGTAAGFAIGYLLKNRVIGENISQLQEQARTALSEARTQAMALEIEARDKAQSILLEAENEATRRMKEISRQETRLQERRDNLDRRLDSLEARDLRLKEREQKLDARQTELDQAWQLHLAELERISGLTQEQAKEELLKNVEEGARTDAARIIREVEAQAHEEADERAREIVTIAIQRLATDQVAETTVSAVELPNDEMKGRIIGRGGRNIRSIEAATGVDLIIDDTPDAVILSSFDPIKREIARLSLETLVVDGRIHPSRIEDVVEKVTKEITDNIWDAGQQATFELGLHGINPELIKLIGKLKYRTSFSQNVYQHSLEVAHLCGILAVELGVNQKTAKRVGLLHDIGKAVDHEVEGSHALIGADIAKRYGESNKVVESIASHHNEAQVNSVYGFLVQAADSLSAARPGARREMLENYIKRLVELETIATSFDGVSKAYAVQAGREVRVMVDVDKVSDDGADFIAQQITKAIEDKLTYPGQIRVVVIRESRAVRFAK